MESVFYTLQTTKIESDINYFIVIHDQNILQQCEDEGRFNILRDFKYIFVGNGEVTRIANLDKVIIARNQPENIEQYPCLCSFTAWYLIAKNCLATKKHVVLLEYDVSLNEDFCWQTAVNLREYEGIIGYKSFPLSHPMYMHATPWLVQSLKTVYGVNVQQLIDTFLKAGGSDYWTSTTNLAMSVKTLKTFVDWFLPLSGLFRTEQIGAHVHERTIPVFCILNHLQNTFIPGVLVHHHKLSHGFKARSWDDAQKEADKCIPHITS